VNVSHILAALALIESISDIGAEHIETFDGKNSTSFIEALDAPTLICGIPAPSVLNQLMIKSSKRCDLFKFYRATRNYYCLSHGIIKICTVAREVLGDFSRSVH
jgi:hypothetical protein